MKTISIFFLFSLWSLLLLTSCKDECTSTSTYIQIQPEYKLKEEVRAMVRFEAAKPIEALGKIYYYNELLLVNEPNKGIHIIQNSNPSSPIPLGYLNIPGNRDMAVKDGYLYADSFTDLLVFNLQQVDFPLIKRVENAFPYYQVLGYSIGTEDKFLVDWKETGKSVSTSEDCGVVFNNNCPNCVTLELDALASATPRTFTGTSLSSYIPSAVGLGGSLARFAVVGQALYAVDNTNLYVFNVSQAPIPQFDKTIPLGWGIETIFPYQNKLFMGAMNGMHIYNAEDAFNPSFLSTYIHITSCDPVVVQGNYAYVTLRNGTFCQGFSNQLEVIDISNVTNPNLLKTYPMTNPFGLGLDGNTLFLCDGADGLKVFDKTNPLDIKQIAHHKGMQALDVIPLNNTLMMIAEEGIYQYDYQNVQNIQLLSVLKVQK
jgi:hypothetical protein